MSETPAIDYFADDANPEPPQPATLERLMALANELKDLDAQCAADLVALEEKQGKADKIRRRTLPDLMAELGMEEFKLTTGEKVTIKEDIKCGLTEDNKPIGYAWLRDHDYGGIIKTKVSLDFGKGDEAQAKAAVEALQQAGFDPDCADSVHPATLKSFVKERLESGDDIPLATFGVYEFKEAKIALPRSRGGKR